MSCDCKTPVEPGSALERLSHSASRVVGARVTNEFARGLVEYCSTNNCSQSAAIRTALAKLAKASDDPVQAFTALVDVLGLADVPAAELTSAQIQQAVADLLTAVPPEGDAPVPDPMAAPADAPPPPALAASKPAPAAVHLTAAQLAARQAAASKLTPAQAAACARRGLPPTAASWAALCKTVARAAGKAEPARAAPPVARALTNKDVTGYSDAERAFMKKHSLTRAEFQARKAAAARSTK